MKKTLPDAVKSQSEFRQRLKAGEVDPLYLFEGRERYLRDLALRELEAATIDPFDEFHDVARWLPELAGDRDLPEAEWVRVNRQSQALVDAFATVRATAATDRPRSYGGRRELFESGLRELRAVADVFPKGKIERARE